jgi:hypothetical protein
MDNQYHQKSNLQPTRKRYPEGLDHNKLQKTDVNRAVLSPASIIGLQHLIGNAAVQRLLAGDRRSRPGTGQAVASAEGSSADISQGSPGFVQRMTSLGQFEVKQQIYDSKVFPLTVGTTDEWKKLLEEMDDEEDYTANLAAFLWLANDPALLRKGRHRLGDQFLSMPSRAPTDTEKMAFVRALYTTGKDLDLPDKFTNPFDDDEAGVYVFDLRAGIAALIRDYGGRVIAELGNRVIDRTGVIELAKEGGTEARGAMLESAAATAYKGVDLYVTALTILDDSRREIEKASASETIRNAGRVIKTTLREHDAAFKERQEWQAVWLGRVFDQLWDFVPGGGIISATAKSLLANGFKESFTELPATSDPRRQMDLMADKFASQVNQLVEKEDAFMGIKLSSADANAIINGFEATRD